MKNLKITFFRTTVNLFCGLLLFTSCDNRHEEVLVFEDISLADEQKVRGSFDINPIIKDLIKITGKQPAPAIETLLENATITIRTRSSDADIVLLDDVAYSDLTWPMRISPDSYNILIRSGNYVADAFFVIEENENEVVDLTFGLDGMFYSVNFSPEVIAEYPDIRAEITISNSGSDPFIFLPNALTNRYYHQLFSFEGLYWFIVVPAQNAELSITATENSGELLTLNQPLSGATGLGFNKEVTFNIEFSNEADETSLDANITVTEAEEVTETVLFPPTN